MSRSTMCVVVLDFAWIHTSILKSASHTLRTANSIRIWRSEVVTVTRSTITSNFCINLSTTSFCVFIFFKYQNSRTFTHNKSVTFFIKWAASLSRIFIKTSRKSVQNFKCNNTKTVNCRFSATSQTNIKTTASNHIKSSTKSISTTRTSSSNRLNRTVTTKSDGDISTNFVWNKFWNCNRICLNASALII